MKKSSHIKLLCEKKKVWWKNDSLKTMWPNNELFVQNQTHICRLYMESCLLLILKLINKINLNKRAFKKWLDKSLLAFSWLIKCELRVNWKTCLMLVDIQCVTYIWFKKRAWKCSLAPTLYGAKQVMKQTHVTIHSLPCLNDEIL